MAKEEVLRLTAAAANAKAMQTTIANDRGKVLSRQEFMALEGQIVQETVLADELAASEVAQKAQLQRLEVALQESQAVGVSPRSVAPRGSAQAAVEELRSGELQAFEEADAAQSRERELEERVAKLERCLKGQEHGEVAENKLRNLEEQERQLTAEVRQERHSELEAHEAAKSLKERVLDLSADCGQLILGDSHQDLRKSEQAAALLLHRLLPQKNNTSAAEVNLVNFLELLEEEREAVVALAEDQVPLDGGNRRLEEVQEEVELLANQLAQLEEDALKKARQLTQVEAQAQLAGQAMAEIDDRLGEACTLRKENQLLQRQQDEWRRSEARMMQLATDLQGQKSKGAQSQAVLAARLMELKRELLPSTGARGSDRRDADRSGSSRGALADQLSLVEETNKELRQRIRRLEDEKAQLVHHQRGLDSFFRSRVPDIEAKLSGGGGGIGGGAVGAVGAVSAVGAVGAVGRPPALQGGPMALEDGGGGSGPVYPPSP
eukprot:TRINITY_DN20065_c0_g3_i2.p1 TRINITY_DN20065_c0_g3~~TRINITY_DN20065_c0_g3_i2.p1  ORF type:complete len:570 (-),score=172.22 TRINITY_DN20065_c0_g3_i2:87-1565(-)